ncbi:DUF1501 domain-containing protein [bacterium]|nr:DUF1501 domain-containing protein [bacterium]
MRGRDTLSLTRRTCLQSLGGLWLGLRPTLSWSHDETPTWPGFGRAKSVIFLVTNGGQSQIDTWDPKPEAPAEIRGAFSAIETRVPGTRICEHLPRMAAMANKYAIVRSMSHEDLDHGSALYLTLTGRYHARRSSNPPPQPSDWPMHGAIVKRLRGVRTSLDAAVTVNGPAQIPINIGPGQNAGLLGSDYDPLLLGDITAEPTVLPGLSPLPALDIGRRHQRDDLLRSLEQSAAVDPATSAYANYNILSDRARNLLDRPEVCHAFDIDRESESLRRQYGMDRSGQACLLARRLVEAGVPWITVFWNHTGRGQDLAPDVTTEYGWDTHNDIFLSMRDRLLPRFDQSVSTLLRDLDERGLLDETLFVVAGEFGRAPLVALEKTFVGESPGRKHWGFCYSILLAGAGVVSGQVIGSSDSRGAYPATDAYGPWDLAATMYSALGIDPAGHFTDRLNRPLMLTEGRVMSALYGS